VTKINQKSKQKVLKKNLLPTFFFPSSQQKVSHFNKEIVQPLISVLMFVSRIPELEGRVIVTAVTAVRRQPDLKSPP
jgi:hypothetical protein